MNATGNTSDSDGLSPWRLWWLVAGFAVWGSALGALYGLHGLGCAFAWPAGVLRLMMALVLLVHLGVLGWVVRHLYLSGGNGTATGRFLRAIFMGSALSALAATVLTFAPPLLLTVCT
jgi:hypothetical protein